MERIDRINRIELIEEIRTNIEIIYNFLTQQETESELSESDAIFVCGHVDERVAIHAGNLFLKGKAPRIIISGGIGFAKRDPAGFPSEAEYFSSVIRKMGVPKDAIIEEDKAKNTLQNVQFGMQKAQEKEKGIKIESIIIVSIPSLLCRARATFLKHYPKIKTYRSSCKITNDWSDLGLVERILGELKKLDEYSEKGDIARVEIPDNVRKACLNIEKVLTSK